MKLRLEKTGDPHFFQMANEDGVKINVEGKPRDGEAGKAFRPMQLVAAGLAGCSSIDVLSILRKQKQEIATFEVEVDARRKDEVPAVFEQIHLQFRFSGKLDADKVKRALDLTIGKYCSVSKMLEQSVRITADFEIH